MRNSKAVWVKNSAKVIRKTRKAENNAKYTSNKRLDFDIENLCASFLGELTGINIDNINLSERDRIMYGIYEDTVGEAVKSTSKIIRENLYKRLPDVDLFKIFLKSSLHVAESIIAFEEKIDKSYPGISGSIIDAVGAVAKVVTLCMTPIIGMILVTTGIADDFFDFFKKENLEKKCDQIVDLLQKREKLKKINSKLMEILKDPKLPAQLYELFKTDVKAIGLFVAALEKAALEKNGNVGKIFKAFSAFTEHMPKNRSEIDNLVKSQQKAVMAEIDKTSVSESEKNSLKDMLDEKIKILSRELRKSLNSDSSVFERIEIIRSSFKDFKFNQIDKDASEKINKAIDDTIKGSKKIDTIINYDTDKSFKKVVHKIYKDKEVRANVKKIFGVDHLGKVRRSRKSKVNISKSEDAEHTKKQKSQSFANGVEEKRGYKREKGSSAEAEIKYRKSRATNKVRERG